MKYRELRNLVQFHLKDVDESQLDPNVIDTFINEGLRILCQETLLLEGKSSSLTYSGTNGGFTVPTDFIKVKDLIWVDPSSGNHSIRQVSLESVYKLRNDWVLLNESAGEYLEPLGYAIHNGTIILDSTTQTSPTLYYYKYDTALSDADDTPSIDSEFHSMIADYAIYKLTRDMEELARWRLNLRQLSASKFRQGKTARARYSGL